MKALCITGVKTAEVRDIPPPAPLSADCVLLKVHYVGFCGSDLNTFRGKNPLAGFPRVPGHEIAAVIESCGSAVPAEWQVGTEVTVNPYTSCGRCSSCRAGRFNACRTNETLGVQREGAMAEYLSVPWQKLHRAPGLSLKHLALVEPLTIGFHASSRARIEAGEFVCVLGCGAVGLGAVAGTADLGARVIAVDIDDGKLGLAKKAGARYAVNTTKADLHAVLREIHGEGPAVIIEAIGLPATYQQAVDEVAFSGRVVCIGYAQEPVSFQTKLFVQKELDIRGSRNALPSDFNRVLSVLARGDFPLDAMISRIVPLAGAADALREWDAHPADFTRILVAL